MKPDSKSWNSVVTRWGKIWKICLFVSTEYTNVTDAQTDGRTDTARDVRGRAYALHRAAKSNESRKFLRRLCSAFITHAQT